MSGVEKLIAKLTTDQIGGVTVFETMGYKIETLLRDQISCPLDTEPLALLEGAVARGALSARAFDRVVRVSRTIEISPEPTTSSVSTSPKRSRTAEPRVVAQT